MEYRDALTTLNQLTAMTRRTELPACLQAVHAELVKAADLVKGTTYTL